MRFSFYSPTGERSGGSSGRHAHRGHRDGDRVPESLHRPRGTPLAGGTGATAPEPPGRPPRRLPLGTTGGNPAPAMAARRGGRGVRGSGRGRRTSGFGGRLRSGVG